MRQLKKILMEEGLARTGAEAVRLIKQGSVKVGACIPECSRFTNGFCKCGGWEKITNPFEDIGSGFCVMIGNGNWRCIPKLEESGFDQLKGIVHE